MTLLVEMIRLGLSSLRLHKMRAFLTALGIIIGVAAVIIMVSLGEGSKRRALEQIERLGARNIIIRSQKPPETQQQQGGQRRSFMSKYGITRADLRVIQESFPGLEAVVPLKEVGGQVHRGNRRRTSQSFGTTPDLRRVANLRVARGRYLIDEDMRSATLVAVIGSGIARELFPFDDPLDATLRIDNKVLRVVGILEPIGLAGGAGSALVGRDINFDIHIPITTASAVFGDQVFRRESGSFQASEVQISELYLAVPTSAEVLGYNDLVERLVRVRHPDLKDASIIVPYELLESARKSAVAFQSMLVLIAGISLLVGGIGIMNIMLASVTERTREIGIRRALGATRHNITAQFLVETGVLSSIAGLIGAALGVGGSLLLERAVPLLPGLPFIGSYVSEDVVMPMQVTGWSILLAFVFATLTGLVAGLYPAVRAARLDPIVALRYG